MIEAKITEDDGTARDKVTRIQHLGELSLAGRSEDDPKYEVIACIGGRGFGVRREELNLNSFWQRRNYHIDLRGYWEISSSGVNMINPETIA